MGFLGMLRGSQNPNKWGGDFRMTLFLYHPGKACWCGVTPLEFWFPLLSRNMVLNRWNPVSQFLYLQNEASDYMNLIKQTNGNEACRRMSSQSKYSYRLTVSYDSLPWSCHLIPLTLGPFGFTLSGGVRSFLSPGRILSLSTFLTLPCKHRGAGLGQGTLTPKYSCFFLSSSVETPHSNAFPGKKDVAFYSGGKKCFYSSPDMGNSKCRLSTVHQYSWLNNPLLWRPLIRYFAFAHVHTFQFYM